MRRHRSSKEKDARESLVWETLRWVLPLWPYPLSREHRGLSARLLNG
jgi:hypothetical protein